MIEETLVVRRLMTEHPGDSFTIARYVESGGYEALRRALSDQAPEDLIEMIKASGLRGRGGAGFPTGNKWAFIPKDVKPKYVVVNDDEGEPCTFKDREITERDPHSIIEGALICAYAVGAEAVYIYVRGEFSLGMQRLEAAIADARSKGFVGKSIMGTDFSCEVYAHPGAGAYICGEETALLESLEGYRGQPRLRPPFFPAIKGLYHQPTVVNNVETLATVAHIVNKGVDWFKSMGTEKSPGPKIFSISGRVNRPGNYELPLGTPMGSLLEIAGGFIDDAPFKAVIPGGASAPWLDTLDITMDFEALGAAASMLGSGSVVFIDANSCVVEMAMISTRFFNHESCGKCTPCREGTWWTVKILERIEGGEGRPEDLKTLIDVTNNMSAPGPAYVPKGQCFCALGDGAAWSLRSAINLFEQDFVAHIEQHGCPMRIQSPSQMGVA
ncbi:MAG: NADH-quinone oxidoreductase subunit NuoF [Actinomycetota bacterium]|nr:NADH-quinone oxidoreductase subunit NuoF [Actinomycetota bacterium]